ATASIASMLVSCSLMLSSRIRECTSSRATSAAHIYFLSLHGALPISFELLDGALSEVVYGTACGEDGEPPLGRAALESRPSGGSDRKSTRLNSSHVATSYAVFCLKKKIRSASHPRRCLSHVG